MGDELRVRAERTPIDHEELRAALARAWRELRAEEPSSDAISILIAHTALETGRWRDAMNWNLGGIKATGAERHTFYSTRERLARKEALAAVAASTTTAPCRLAAPDKGAAMLEVIVAPPHPMCRFRAYSDLGASARDYLGLLVRKYPAAIERAAARDARAYVDALRDNGYFNGDPSKYRNGVASLFDEYKEPCLSTAAEVKEALARLGFSNVKAFQLRHELAADDVVGAMTRAVMRSRLANSVR